MKKIFLLLLLSPILSFAQKDSTISYTEVVTTDSASKDFLYARAKNWFNATFVAGSDALQIEDQDQGELSAKGIFSTYVGYRSARGRSTYEMKYKFKVTILVKDNRYKYAITDIDNFISADGNVIPFRLLNSSNHTSVKWPGVKPAKVDEEYVTAKKNVDAKVQELINSIKDAMKKRISANF